MGIREWFSEQWSKAAGQSNPAAASASLDKAASAPSADQANNRVPMPGRHGSGMYANWNAQLVAAFTKVQVLQPAYAKDGIGNVIVFIRRLRGLKRGFSFYRLVAQTTILYEQ